jgi:amidase
MRNDFDPDFGTAVDAAAVIRAKQMSSVELTQHTLRRIDAFQPTLNAYVYQLREDALAAAAAADEAIARSEDVGPLHGVPITVKESFGVAGYPCTWGIPPLRNAKAPAHSVAVRRLLEAGAILLGATNVPLELMDGQSFNAIYGTSNNPWDLSRTPGGSSGGTAAAIAAGLAFLGMGSDIGGSIRAPAAFCGIYGHKPTLDLISLTGHAPGGTHEPAGFSTLLAAAGPMARSADDIEIALRVLAEPRAPESKAFKWTLPSPRHHTLADFRVGYLLEDRLTPVSAETQTVLESVIRACESAGATLRHGWPDGVRFRDVLDTYYFMLGAVVFSLAPPAQREHARSQLATRPEQFVKGALSSFADWQQENMKRLAYRAVWEQFFQSVDVFLLPTTFTTAFPHDPSHPDGRTIPTPEGGAQPFWDLLSYIVPATLTGCPAINAPAGLGGSGLPVGVQIVGPYLEDATPIAFARLLAQEIGGFKRPEGYTL